MTDERERSDRPSNLAEQADAPERGLFREFFGFLLHNKKWWLIPVIVVLLLLAGVLIIGSSAVAPFIYTLF